MASYAIVGDDGTVENLIEADSDAIAQHFAQGKSFWRFDPQYGEEPPGVGFTYNADADVFISPRPGPDWVLGDNFDWQPPPVEPRAITE